MKKSLKYIEYLFLSLSIIMLLLVVFYQLISMLILKQPQDTAFLEYQLILVLIYFFSTTIISAIFAKILKLDLSYKGPNLSKYVPKPLKIVLIIAFILILIIAIILKIKFYYIITVGLLCVLILFQYGTAKYFKCFS